MIVDSSNYPEYSKILEARQCKFVTRTTEIQIILIASLSVSQSVSIGIAVNYEIDIRNFM